MKTETKTKKTETKESAGFRGYGSFMVAESVEEMIARACRGETVAELPFDSEEEEEGLGATQDFGLDLDGFTFVNHGAFGAALRLGSRRANQWRQFAEEQPLRYFDRELFPCLVESARRLAAFVGARPDQVALTSNATAGIEAVIASKAASARMRDPHGKTHALVFDTTYGSVKKMAARHFEGRVHELALPLPLADEDGLLADVASQLDRLDAQAPVEIAVLDHVTSNTALRLPVEELCKLFAARGIPVLVDGAHGPWATALNLDALSCDYYVGNCHKWLCAPKSVGFLFARRPRETAGWLRPRITSHGDGAPFPGSFYWDGCRDYAAALALPAVLDYWARNDASAARERCISLLHEARDVLEERWGTANARLAPANSAFTDLPMTCVGLPPAAGGSSSDAHGLQERLYHGHRVECPVKAINGALYLRLSSHVYNSLEHYEAVGRAVDDALDAR